MARTVQANGGTYDVDAAAMYDQALAQLPKGQTGLLPFDIHIKNELGEEFVERCFFRTSWDGDTLKLAAQIASIAPEH